MNRYRIGMMADLYKPHISGITNFISLNKSILEQAGHDVFVFTFGDVGISDNETNVIRSPGLPLVDTGYYLSFQYSKKAKALLQTMDIVHVHHPFLSGRLALRYCRPVRIPIVFTNHTRYDLYAQSYLPLLPEELSTSFLQSYMPSFCSAVDMVVSPSKGMAGVLEKLGVQTAIQVVPNGVDLQKYQVPCADCRLEFGYQKDDLLLVYSGRLAPEKNLDFLIQSFAGLVDAIPTAKLLILGSGSEEEKIGQQVALLNLTNQITLAGMVPYDELPRYLAMCDIFVTASVTEVHPLSVIEAMASGLPVVGIQSVGVGDTIEDGITGYLARNDVASFTAKLTRLCLDKTLRKKMGTTARNSARKYAIERTSAIMLEHYERLITGAQTKKRGLRYRLRSLLERYRG